MAVKAFASLAGAALITIGALSFLFVDDDRSTPGLTLSYSQDSNLALAAATALRKAEAQPMATSEERRVELATSTPSATATATLEPTDEPATDIDPTAEPTTEEAATGPLADASQPEAEEDDDNKKEDSDDEDALVAATVEPTPTEEPEPEPEPTDNSWSSSEQQMLAKHNQARNGEGTSSLSPDSELKAMAEYRCQQLGSNFSHDGFRPALSKFGISYSAAGENLATIASVGTAFNAWMGSPGHRANILENAFDRVGIAQCQAGGQTYWVVDFAG